MKKLIDIEKLLQWAMRDELPKGRPVSSSAWDLIAQFAQLGVRVQTSGPADGLGFVPGAPHEDAVLVAAAIERVDDVATFNDDANVFGLFGDLAPIAGECIAPIRSAQFNPRALVISKAISGTRPAWKFEHPTPYQMRREIIDPRGAVRHAPIVYGIDADGDLVEMKPNRGRAVARDGMYSFAFTPRSPLQWNDPSLLAIGHARAEYVAWHGALISLVAALKGKLAEYEPTMPAAVARPWITGQPVSRVLSDGKPASPIGLALVPKRPAGGRPIESEIVRKSRPRPDVLRLARARKADKTAAFLEM